MVFDIVAGMRQQPGWPDTWIGHTRWQGFIEFKGTRTKLKTIQKLIIKKLQQRGVEAWVFRAPDRIEDYEGNLQKIINPVNGDSILKALEELRDGTAQ